MATPGTRGDKRDIFSRPFHGGSGGNLSGDLSDSPRGNSNLSTCGVRARTGKPTQHGLDRHHRVAVE